MVDRGLEGGAIDGGAGVTLGVGGCTNVMPGYQCGCRRMNLEVTMPSSRSLITS